jgi:hypothetical protein
MSNFFIIVTRTVFWFFSPFKQLSLISVWAWVGYGKSKTLENVKKTKKDGDPDKIIDFQFEKV